MKKIAASIYQERFWLEWKLHPKSTAYNTPVIFEIQGNLNIPVLEKAVCTVFNLQDCFKSYFVEENEKLHIVILDQIKCHIDYEDISGESIEKRAVLTEKFVNKMTGYLFDLTQPPLFKAALLKQTDDKYIFILNAHHIITDALTGGGFIFSVSKLYNIFLSKINRLSFMVYQKLLPRKMLKKIPRLKDYLDYERENYTKKNKQQDLNYWQESLSDTNLYVDFSVVPASELMSGKLVYFNFDDDLTALFNKVLHKLSTTPFILLSAIYGATLAKYTRQNSIALNYPVNMRPKLYRYLFGCYVNNLVLKIEITENMTFEDLVSQLTQRRKSDKQHQRIPLTDIIFDLKKTGKLTTNNFLNVSLAQTFLRGTPLK